MILIHILIGVLCTSLLLFLIHFAKKRSVEVKIWQWLIVLIEILYIAFVLELIVGFLEEGSGRAALVMGFIFGMLALIGSVLLARFVFNIKQKR